MPPQASGPRRYPLHAPMIPRIALRTQRSAGTVSTWILQIFIILPDVGGVGDAGGEVGEPTLVPCRTSRIVMCKV